MKPVALLVQDLGFGDAGKGSTVDALARRYQAHTVVRFCGGCQAAHNVVLPDGTHHTFAQFSSGFFAGARTYLSEFMLVEPLAFLNEAAHLKKLGYTKPGKAVFVNRNAPITTPFHIVANRLRETERGKDRNGSCGMGIGETVQDQLDGLSLTAGDLLAPRLSVEKLQAIKARKLEQFGVDFGINLNEFLPRYAEFAQSVNIVSSDFFQSVSQTGVVIFEGAQGVLLDEWHGFHPYTTWSTTTFENAQAVLKDYNGEIVRLGLLRSHMIRHGPGPLPTEDTEVRKQIVEQHNKFGEWQREVRFGWIDLQLIDYALQAVGGVDFLGLTHLDQVPLSDGLLRLCNGYDSYAPKVLFSEKNSNRLLRQGEMTAELFKARPCYSDYKIKLNPERDLRIALQDQLGIPVGVSSTGATFVGKSYSADFNSRV